MISSPKNWFSLFFYPRKNFLFILLIFLFSALSTLCQLSIPLQIGQAIDLMKEAQKVDFLSLQKIAQMLFLLFSLSFFFQHLLSLCVQQLSYQITFHLRSHLFKHYLHLPLSIIQQKSYGDLINRITQDMNQISQGISQGLSGAFSACMTILGILFFLADIYPPAIFLFCILSPLPLFSASWISKKTSHHFQKQAQSYGEMSAYLEEMISNHHIVKLFSYETQCQNLFEQKNQVLHEIGLNAQFYSSLTNPVTRFINALLYAVIVLFGGIHAFNGLLSIGQLSSLLAYTKQYTKPFNEIAEIFSELQNTLASGKRVFALLAEKEEDKQDYCPLLAPSTKISSLSFQKVHFSYSPEEPFLKDIHFQAQGTEKIAIVGETGCGKSTLLSLILRFYEVQKGEIALNGINIRQIPKTQLYHFFGVVLQDSWIFEGTIFENIAYGNPEATLPEVKKIANIMNIHEWIEHLPQKYDTKLSSFGNNLSAGEKQLLCLARVMMKNPAVLILDEATSSLDAYTEKRVQLAFYKLMQGRMSFIVAHRLSTIEQANQILVMKKGEIIEKGTHQELLQNRSYYHDLYQKQYGSNSLTIKN
ncbi:sugar ABC transporter ATP-binding protein [Clostridia bacterium]|nr:sugar ABC transporter ATP-binding protein [Clostridia bacterium]